MDKKILVGLVVAVIIVAVAAVILLNPGDGDKDDKPAKTGYTITFDANGGSGTMAPVTGISGTYTPPTTCGFTAPEGHSFQGWGLSKWASYSGTIEVDSDTTLYAIWNDDKDLGITVIPGYLGDLSPYSPIVSDISFIYESGGKSYNPSFSEFKTGLVPYYGSATMTIKVNGSSDWSYKTDKVDTESKNDAGIFEFTYNGEKYKLAIEVDGSKFSGNADSTPTFTFSTDGKAYMNLYIGKVA